jgi:hypothetical protein
MPPFVAAAQRAPAAAAAATATRLASADEEPEDDEAMRLTPEMVGFIRRSRARKEESECCSALGAPACGRR